jgi:hypothetical protein
MPDGTFYKTRAAMKLRVEASTDGALLTIGVGRCFLGWKEINLTELDAYADAAALGPFGLIGLTTNKLEWTRVGPMTIPIDIFIAKAKSAPWTGQDVENLIQNVISRLLDQSGYTSALGGHVPMSVGVTGYEYDIDNTPGLLVVHMSADCIDPNEPILTGPMGLPLLEKR